MAPYIPFLVVHIAAGCTALIAGTVALSAEKGGPLHCFAGRLFFWAMITVTLSALVIALLRPNAFLFTIGLFSLYLVFAGRRAANLRSWTDRRPDWLAGALMLAAALGMIGRGGMMLTTGQVGLAPVLIVFGLIGGALAVQDLIAIHRRPEAAASRLARHVGRMIGGMIAATTAFVVVNGSFLPELLRWLGPTVIFVPFIVYWTRRLTRA
jgi:hypothetical protein